MADKKLPHRKEVKLIPGLYYWVLAIDHNLSIHHDDDLFEQKIKFVGRYIKEDKYHYLFHLLEYEDDERPDIFQAVKSCIIDIKDCSIPGLKSFLDTLKKENKDDEKTYFPVSTWVEPIFEEVVNND
jgi:hypothetical protein